MPSLTAYRGLQVVSPDPTGDGGLAIQDDLKQLVDWNPKSVWSETANPTATDDQTEDFFPGSLWLRANTTPPQLFVCKSAATNAAEWQLIPLEIVQDTSPQLGGDLDTNGHKIVSSSDGDIELAPDGSGNTVILNGNFGLQTNSFGSLADGVFAAKVGAAPESDVADCFQQYAADAAVGNAAPHFRTEDGSIVKLYQQANIADPSGGGVQDSQARTAINTILTALENLGLLATT